MALSADGPLRGLFLCKLPWVRCFGFGTFWYYLVLLVLWGSFWIFLVLWYFLALSVLFWYFLVLFWWRHLLQFWPPSCCSCRLGQQLALLELVTSLATKWCLLHKFHCWPPDGATCIATLPMITLSTSSVGIELLSSSARVTSVKFQKPLGVRETWTHRSDPR